MNERIIAHLDMDAFFASVEVRDKPYLKGMPIVIGADPKGGSGRGVVSTASYEARRYGIHSALPISKAWRFSEEAKKRGDQGVVFITPAFHKYVESSHRVMAILRKYTPLVEEASIDEAYFDISMAGSFKKAEKIVQKIKDEIKREEGLTCSVGIASNKMLSKIAAQEEKPDGLTVVLPEQSADFLASKSVSVISGVGPKTLDVFSANKIKTIKEARLLSEDKLVSMFGKWGSDLFQKLLGVDDSDVVSEPDIAKSCGEQETFEIDTLDLKFVMKKINTLCVDVFEKIKLEGFVGFRTVVLTVRFADFETKTRSFTSKKIFKTARELEQTILALVIPFLDRQENPQKKKIRLLGVRAEKLESKIVEDHLF
ncbi:MAG: DNA polymerase IV [Candidatus Paceibacterota bacterium]|jgi:DNA polymerase IV (DinB-like DNA polymerase)